MFWGTTPKAALDGRCNSNADYTFDSYTYILLQTLYSHLRRALTRYYDTSLEFDSFKYVILSSPYTYHISEITSWKAKKITHFELYERLRDVQRSETDYSFVRPGAHVRANYYGEWHSARIERVLESDLIEVEWEEDMTHSHLPIEYLREF